MNIRFTKHAEEKFGLFLRHGLRIPRKNVVHTILAPESVDHRSRSPLSIAQSTLDQNHVLRVVYRQEENTVVVITFYPGRKPQYEKR